MTLEPKETNPYKQLEDLCIEIENRKARWDKYKKEHE